MSWSDRDLIRPPAWLPALGIVAALGSPAHAAAPAVDLLSHRAAYRLSLAHADSASGMNRVVGGLVLEWRAACDGWLSQQRLGFVAEMDDGPGFTYDVRFSSWESLDSTQLRFNVRTFDGPAMQEEFRGLAKLAGPGDAGIAHYQLPEAEEVTLPAGTIFPTTHVSEIIAAARAGERIITRQVFDGSGDDALTRATAVIGAPRQVALVAGGAAERTWPVSIAYFAADGEDVLPQFEIAFDLSEGGVLSKVRLNYGDFSLRAELEKLETFARPDCR